MSIDMRFDNSDDYYFTSLPEILMPPHRLQPLTEAFGLSVRPSFHLSILSSVCPIFLEHNVSGTSWNIFRFFFAQMST